MGGASEATVEDVGVVVTWKSSQVRVQRGRVVGGSRSSTLLGGDRYLEPRAWTAEGGPNRTDTILEVPTRLRALHKQGQGSACPFRICPNKPGHLHLSAWPPTAPENHVWMLSANGAGRRLRATTYFTKMGWGTKVGGAMVSKIGRVQL